MQENLNNSAQDPKLNSNEVSLLSGVAELSDDLDKRYNAINPYTKAKVDNIINYNSDKEIISNPLDVKVNKEELKTILEKLDSTASLWKVTEFKVDLIWKDNTIDASMISQIWKMSILRILTMPKVAISWELDLSNTKLRYITINSDSKGIIKMPHNTMVQWTNWEKLDMANKYDWDVNRLWFSKDKSDYINNYMIDNKDAVKNKQTWETEGWTKTLYFNRTYKLSQG